MKLKMTYWKETDGTYLGYLQDHPDHWTQGENFEDLKEHLWDLYREFRKGDLPGIKKWLVPLFIDRSMKSDGETT